MINPSVPDNVSGTFSNNMSYPEGAQALSGPPTPPPQVEQLFMESEARAEIIFNFAAGAFDVGEFDFDLLGCAGCSGACTPVAQPMTLARAALSRACARCSVARSEWLV